MSTLTRRDYATALDCLQDVAAAADSLDGFAQRAVAALPRLVAAELTTVSFCDLASGHRHVTGSPRIALSAADRDAFDRHFFAHPLVRAHGFAGRTGTQRIGDVVAPREFRRSALFSEYYRRIGIDAVMAIPLAADRHRLVGCVLNRSGRDFSERERDLAELLRPSLAALFRHATAQFGPLPVTRREREVLEWAARGKTNRDIACILGMSPRTVEKHLERIYVKLGVESRTAAVMRALKRRPETLDAAPAAPARPAAPR